MYDCVCNCLSLCSDLYNIAALAGRSLTTLDSKPELLTSLRSFTLSSDKIPREEGIGYPTNVTPESETPVRSKCPYVLGPQYQHVFLRGPGDVIPSATGLSAAAHSRDQGQEDGVSQFPQLQPPTPTPRPCTPQSQWPLTSPPLQHLWV